jgi:hypothetical protein
MRKVERAEVVDYVSYEEHRAEVRDAAMKAKGERRVHVGPHLTFLFENQQTIHYQIQEMTRAERMVKEADIVHEIETYNELLGGPGEVGCTLLVELDDPAARPRSSRSGSPSRSTSTRSGPTARRPTPATTSGRWATPASRRCSTSSSRWARRRRSPSAATTPTRS